MNCLRAAVTGTPLAPVPRRDIPKVVVDEFTDRAGFEQLLPGIFGSQKWLGTESERLLIDSSSSHRTTGTSHEGSIAFAQLSFKEVICPQGMNDGRGGACERIRWASYGARPSG